MCHKIRLLVGDTATTELEVTTKRSNEKQRGGSQDKSTKNNLWVIKKNENMHRTNKFGYILKDTFDLSGQLTISDEKKKRPKTFETSKVPLSERTQIYFLEQFQTPNSLLNQRKRFETLKLLETFSRWVLLFARMKIFQKI